MLGNFLDWLGGIVWGPAMMILLVGTGIFLTFRLRLLQFFTLPYALKLAFSPKSQDKQSEGDISHFQSLMTALSATVGNGNIAGVATAVVAGGPGAIFWMWVTAIFGMATKYGEAILAVKYRITNERGTMSGGPMYYIEKGLGWKWLAVLFAIFGSVAAFGIGNMVQANSVADVLKQGFGVNPWIVGLALAILTGLVILGGIKSIGRASSIIVPFMCVFYFIGGLIIVLMNLPQVPAAFATIFYEAFAPQSVAGGALGTAIRFGVARGIFSNEAGLGSAPIAAAAAKTDHPGRQALVSMTGTFIDTIIVCSVTGLALVMSGVYIGADPSQGASLTVEAFDSFLPVIGGLIVTFGSIFFAYSTILGWSYYGEKCFAYLFGERSITFYRTIFVIAVFFGAPTALQLIWDVADIFNALMAIPNLIGLLFLSGVIASETKKFLEIREREKLGEVPRPSA